MGEVIKEARLNGIRPMTIGKLLAYLGYDMGTPILGRTEISDMNAMKRLTAKRSQPEGQPKAAPTTKSEDEAADTKKDADAGEMKKDEPADDDQPKAKAKTAVKKAEAKKKAADEEDQ